MSTEAAPRRIGRPARLGVDLRGSFGLVGTLLKYLSLATLFPTAIALGYGEPFWPFLVTFAAAGGAGIALERLGGARAAAVGSREGYLVVSLTWLLAAVFGALPLLLSGEPQLDRPIDAFFEAMSGFTTTGSTLVTDVGALDHSLQMWRQFMQWLGGIGIIVLVIAVLPRLRVGGRQMLESELPGPEVDQLGERIRRTARRLWILYVALTAVEAAILAILGWTGIDDKMSLYEAVAHAFTTIPTGGFSTENASIAAFGAATQWVIIAFMILAGINFALLWRVIVRQRFKDAARDEELRLYVVLLALAAALLVAEITRESLQGSGEPVRNGIFQAVAIMTGTGYASVNWALWSTLGLMTLVTLMFIGGAAGSTTGSVKVIRHLLLGRSLKRELRQTVQPELVLPIRLNGAVVDERTLRAVTSFILLYIGIFVSGAGIIVLDTAIQGPDLSPLDAISAAAATLGNVGPATGPAGPMGSYESFSDVSTFTMTMLMWMGRLEVIPVIVLASRRYWRI